VCGASQRRTASSWEPWAPGLKACPPVAARALRAGEPWLWPLPAGLTPPRACARADGHGQRGAAAQPLPPVRRAAQPEAPQHGRSAGAALHAPRTGRSRAGCVSMRLEAVAAAALSCRDVTPSTPALKQEHAWAAARAWVPMLHGAAQVAAVWSSSGPERWTRRACAAMRC